MAGWSAARASETVANAMEIAGCATATALTDATEIAMYDATETAESVVEIALEMSGDVEEIAELENEEAIANVGTVHVTVTLLAACLLAEEFDFHSALDF